jgi:hypothetical protein
MTNILSSASKLVFVLMAVAVIILTVLGKVDPKDFIALASMAFAFYFTRDRGTDTTPKV